MNLLNTDKPTCVAPFASFNKVTWYNGFFMNKEIAKIFTLQFTDNRWEYEYIFNKRDDIQVIGRIRSDVNNDYSNGTINFNTKSKQEMQNYVNNL